MALVLAASVAACTVSAAVTDRAVEHITTACKGLAQADAVYQTVVAGFVAAGQQFPIAISSQVERVRPAAMVICANPAAITDPVTAASVVTQAYLAVVAATREGRRELARR
jgi:hypothetical protein